MSKPTIITSIKAMQEWSKQKILEGKIIGFVPTMGYLHNGHLNLMKLARSKCDELVISIFVNPLQFGPKEDLDRYPRDLEGDLNKAGSVGVDLVFFPSPQEMYPKGYQTTVEVSLLSQPLCGAYRPGHFKGVTTVVAKLFNIIKPHFAVFGKKDYQQLQIIKRMVQDLSMDIRIIEGETTREADGLAMSSRNAYLSPEERQQASIIYKSLNIVKEEVQNKTILHPKQAEIRLKELISSSPLARVQYAQCLDAQSLEEREDFSQDMVLATAVFFDHTRLIDNIVIPKVTK